MTKHGTVARRQPVEPMLHPTPEKLLDASRVADVLGISVPAARKRMQRGQIPTVRLGRWLRVKDSALQAYISQLPAVHPDNDAGLSGPSIKD